MLDTGFPNRHTVDIVYVHHVCNKIFYLKNNRNVDVFFVFLKLLVYIHFMAIVNRM